MMPAELSDVGLPVLETVTIHYRRPYHVSGGKTGGICFYINKCDHSHALWIVTVTFQSPEYRLKLTW